jgi:hypothetical protein
MKLNASAVDANSHPEWIPTVFLFTTILTTILISLAAFVVLEFINLGGGASYYHLRTIDLLIFQVSPIVLAVVTIGGVIDCIFWIRGKKNTGWIMWLCSLVHFLVAIFFLLLYPLLFLFILPALVDITLFRHIGKQLIKK